MLLGQMARGKSSIRTPRNPTGLSAKPSPQPKRLDCGDVTVMKRVHFLGLLILFLAARAAADCTLTNIGLRALPDLGWGTYSNFNRSFVGGLYPNGANTRPALHEAAGLQIATSQIQPLD